MTPPLAFPWKSALRLGVSLLVLALSAPDAPAAEAVARAWDLADGTVKSDHPRV